MDEIIKIKESRGGVKSIYFTNAIQPGIEGSSLAFLKKDAFGTPVEVIPYTKREKFFERDSNNNFVFNPNLNFTLTSGITFTNIEESGITITQKEKIKNDFIQAMIDLSGSTSVSWVFFEDHLIDDYFADIKLIRSYDSLDTLNVKNNLIGEIPKKESATGVLVGRLMARQKITDENDERILIPLKEVPVAIFNPSDEFPSVSSVDNDGDRIRLNITENSEDQSMIINENTNEDSVYFNKQSYWTDFGNGELKIPRLIKEDVNSVNIPDKYTYGTITNEDGEFIITDVPIGPQTLVFEVDLLKQGLTHDEIALNFFPYPATEKPNVDDIPTYFFRQIPVNIVSSWGDFQTGYTELNVTVNLDLRKWATYYVAPISRLEDPPMSIEDMQRAGYAAPMSIQVRDMAREGYPDKNISAVKITEMLDRNENQVLEWTGEFAQVFTKINFTKDDYQAFKLPANMYDPEGQRSVNSERAILPDNVNTQGTPQQGKSKNKGVWLCGYQIKQFYGDEEDIYRETGFAKSSDDDSPISYFSLNRGVGVPTDKSDGTTNVFPYEKKWSHIYPDRYRIPPRPTLENNSSNRTLPTTEPFNPDPILGTSVLRYLEGDISGYNFDNEFGNNDRGASGFGLEYDERDGEFRPNRFSQRVTKGKVYNYERDVYIESQHSSGLKPYDNFQEEFLVGFNNPEEDRGELFQRVEAGYGYWLKPHGWPDVIRFEDFDALANVSSGSLSKVDENPSVNFVGFEPGINDDSLNRHLSLRLDSLLPDLWKTGGLDIYRIVNPEFDNLAPPNPPPVKKFARFIIPAFYRQREFANNRLRNGVNTEGSGRGNMLVDFPFDFGKSVAFNKFKIKIVNAGETSISFEGSTYAVGEVLGGSDGFDASTRINNNSLDITLPTNSSFDGDNNSWENTKYRFEFHDINPSGNPGDLIPEFDFILNTTTHAGDVKTNLSNATYYLVSRYNNIRTNYNSKQGKCKGRYTSVANNIHNVLIDGVILMRDSDSDSSFSKNGTTFRSTKITPVCAGITTSTNSGIDGRDEKSIGIELI